MGVFDRHLEEGISSKASKLSTMSRRNQNMHIESFVDDDSDERHSSKGLSVQFSDSVSLTSSNSTGSSYQAYTHALATQHERVFQHEKDIRTLFRATICGRMSVQRFRESLSNMCIQESSALQKVFRSLENGADVKYTDFLKAINQVDSVGADEFEPPRRVPQDTPLPSMFDAMNQQEDYVRVKSPNPRDNDVLTWSTPPKTKDLPAVQRIQPKSTPIPVYEPPSYTVQQQREPTESASPRKADSHETNAMVQAFMGGSISGSEFIQQLEVVGIAPSDRLSKMIEDYETGSKIRFFDFCKEIQVIQENPAFQKISRPHAPKGLGNATVDIFAMEKAPESRPAPVPHSKEQTPSHRKQKNVFTWEGTDEEPIKPSRKIGSKSYGGSFDIYETKPQELGPATPPKYRGQQDSGDFFNWTSPGPDDQPRSGKKAHRGAAGGGISSIPWGTEDDIGRSDLNPHSYNMTKRPH